MELTSIHQKVTIPATSTAVYDALTDPKQHAVATGSKATGDPKIGGAFTAWDGYIMGTYKELESGKRIVADWKTTGWPKGAKPSLLTIALKEKDGRTELIMDHTDVPKADAIEYAAGWQEYYWKPLKKYFAKKK